VSATLDKLRAEAEKLGAKARERQEDVAAEEARQAAERERRQRAFDERFVADFDPEPFDAELRATYDAVIAAVREWPITQALVAHHAAAVRRQLHYSELNGARTRLGLPLVHEPVLRDVLKLTTILDQVVSQIAGEIAEADREALLEAREGTP
jgi:hypothetical protein